jgi:hypothetical protein
MDIECRAKNRSRINLIGQISDLAARTGLGVHVDIRVASLELLCLRLVSTTPKLRAQQRNSNRASLSFTARSRDCIRSQLTICGSQGCRPWPTHSNLANPFRKTCDSWPTGPSWAKPQSVAYFWALARRSPVRSRRFPPRQTVSRRLRFRTPSEAFVRKPCFSLSPT